MDANVYKNLLLATLKPWARPAGKNHVLTRCKYCPDSKTYSHGHFYISIPEDGSDEPSQFYCQKCHTGGYVTTQRLLEWGIVDEQLYSEIGQYNRRILSLPKNKKYVSLDILPISNSRITTDELTMKKLGYINSRIGVNLSIKDCVKNKIVFNLNDLLCENKLGITRDQRIIDSLDSYFIGFLSYDNAFINMRNLAKPGTVYHTIDKRYVNYNITNKADNTQRIYIIPNALNFNDPTPMELHMAEGPFDVLSIKYNLAKSTYNKIFGGVLGSGYKGLVRFVLTTLKIPNLIIHLYADQDIDRFVIVDLAEFIRPFRIPLYLHRNTFPGQKDFGVPINQIRDSSEKLI